MRKSLRKAIASLLAVALIVGTWSNGSVTAYATEDGAAPVAETQESEELPVVDEQVEEVEPVGEVQEEVATFVNRSSEPTIVVTANSSDTLVYNGKAQSAGVTVSGAEKGEDNYYYFHIDGVEHRFKASAPSYVDAGTYSEVKPNVSNVQKYVMTYESWTGLFDWYEWVDTDVNVGTETGTVTINKRPVTVQSKDITFAYDGSSRRNGVNEISGNLVDDYSIDYFGNKTVTDITDGDVENKFVINFDDENKAQNYDISYVYGKINVTTPSYTLDCYAKYNGVTYYLGEGNFGGKILPPSSYECYNAFTGGEVVVTKDGFPNYEIAPVYKTIEVKGVEYEYDPAQNRKNTYSVNWSEIKAVALCSANKDGKMVQHFHMNGNIVLQNENIYDVAFSVAQPDGSVEVVSAESKVEGSDLAVPTVAEVIEYKGSTYIFAGWYEDAAFTTLATIETLSEDSNYYGKYIEVQTLTLVPDVPENVTYDGTEHFVNRFETTQFGDVTVSGLSVYAEGTNAGSYAVEVTGTAKVTDANNKDVTKFFDVEVESATLVIKPKVVKIASLSNDKEPHVYDGTEFKYEKYLSAALVGEDELVVTFTGSRTIVGETENTFKYEFVKGDSKNYEVICTFGTIHVVANEDLTIRFANYEKPYDGTAVAYKPEETAIVTGLPDNYSIVFDEKEFPEVINVTAPKEYELPYTICDEKGNNVTDCYIPTVTKGYVKVTPIEIKLKSNTISKTYSGEILSTDGVVVVEGGQFVEGEEPEFVFDENNTITRVGDVDNTFKYVFDENVDANNYVITVEFGKLVVTPNPVEINIRFAEISKVYDGDPIVLSKGIADWDMMLIGHDVIITEDAPSVVNVNQSVKEFKLPFQIVNKDGDDVTNCFSNIKVDAGYLEVTKAPAPIIVLNTNLEVKYGKTLSSQRDNLIVDYENLVKEDHYLENIHFTNTSDPSEKEVGDEGTFGTRSENQIIIKDKDGNVVTGNYEKPEERAGKYVIVPADAPSIIVSGKSVYGEEAGLAFNVDYADGFYKENYTLELVGGIVPKFAPVGNYEFEAVGDKVVMKDETRDLKYTFDYIIYKNGDETKTDVKTNFGALAAKGEWEVTQVGKILLKICPGNVVEKIEYGQDWPVNGISTRIDYGVGDNLRFENVTYVFLNNDKKQVDVSVLPAGTTGFISTRNHSAIKIMRGDEDVTANYAEIKRGEGRFEIVKAEAPTIKFVAEGTYGDFAAEYSVDFGYEGYKERFVLKVTSVPEYVPAGTYSFEMAEDGKIVAIKDGQVAFELGYVIYAADDANEKDLKDNFKTLKVSADSKWTVAPKKLTVTIDDFSKVYDGETWTAAPTVSEPVGNDKVDYVQLPTLRNVTDKVYQLTANDVTVTRDGNDVKSNYDITVKQGTLTVTKRPVTVTSASDSKVYDGIGLKNDGYEVTWPEEQKFGFVKGEEPKVLFNVVRTNVGDSDNTFKLVFKDKETEANYEVEEVLGTLDVTPRYLTVTSGTDSKVYDGIGLKNDDYEVTWDETFGYEFGFVEGDAKILFDVVRTNVGTSDNTFEVVFKDEVTKGNYVVATNFGTLTVTKRPVTVATASASKAYDGTGLHNNEVTVTPGEGLEEAFVNEDTPEYEFTGGQMYLGSSPNTVAVVKVMNGEEDVTDNYDVTYVPGTLTITKCPVTVKIVGNHMDVQYTGAEHEVGGYNVEISNNLYKTSDFTFTGNAVARGTMNSDAFYYMGLNASNFVNNSINFDVTFDVTDGYLYIYAAPAPVQAPVEEPEVEEPVAEEVETEEPVVEEPEVEVEVVEDTTPVVSDDLVEIEDEETPLANLKADDGNGPIFWILLAGLFATAALFVFLVVLRRNREEEEQA